jgi:hypothetical protein
MVRFGFLLDGLGGEPGVAFGSEPTEETDESVGPIEGDTGRGSPARTSAAKANFSSVKSRAGDKSAISGRSWTAVSNESSRLRSRKNWRDRA